MEKLVSPRRGANAHAIVVGCVINAFIGEKNYTNGLDIGDHSTTSSTNATCLGLSLEISGQSLMDYFF